MFKKEKITYGYNDISIVPSASSKINHRSKCEQFIYEGFPPKPTLPIFTAPMSTVINDKNYKAFEENNIIPIIPRSVDINVRKEFLKHKMWVALSLNEFKDVITYPLIYLEKKHDANDNQPYKILIDVANGHIKEICRMVESIRALGYSHNELIVMAGNVANPDTYDLYADAGIDYIRLGIGGGNGCITSSNTGVHYGVATLINDTFLKKQEYIRKNPSAKCITKIIADGGIRNYSDVIKALALGADYVMIGGLFSSLIESCANTFYRDEYGDINPVDTIKDNVLIEENNGEFRITYFDENKHYIKSVTVDNLYKIFYGMASSQGQKELFGKKINTSEGCVKEIKVTTNISKWAINMASYMRSAMSYCGVNKIVDFNPNNVDTVIMSMNEQLSINK